MGQVTTLETVGQRVYFANSPFSAKDSIKSIGAKWDADRRQWWVGRAKREAAESLVVELNTPALAAWLDATPASDRLAAKVGLEKGTPADIVADKLQDDGRDREAAAIRTPKQDPHDIRLTGKGRYKGREYYAGAVTKDGTRVRLLTLPDASGDYLDFWADCSQVEQTKTYTPREKWDGRRYSNRTVTVYTTLGSIADFIARARRAEARGDVLPETLGPRTGCSCGSRENGSRATDCFTCRFDQDDN